MRKIRRSLIYAGIIAISALGLYLFSPQTRSLATVGGFNEKSSEQKFDVTVTYDVDNSCDYKGNYITFMDYKCNDYNANPDYPGDYYYRNSYQYGLYEHPISKKAGKGQTMTCSFNTVPGGLYYYISGDSMHISKYYLTKVEVKVKNPVVDLGLPKTITLWEGKFGAKMAHNRGIDLGDPHVLYSALWLNSDGPAFSGWTPDYYGSNREQTSKSNCPVELYGGPRIVGITDMVVPGELSVRTDGIDSSAEMSAAVTYDQFGARWASQRFDISTDKEDKGVTIKYDDNEKKWYIVASSRANAAQDYDVVITQHTLKGKDYPKSAKVRIKTFDYNFKFIDENGNVVKTMTADYGQTVEEPDSSHVWICNDYADWSNTTEGPQDRVVRGVVKMPEDGTKDNPIMINTIDDWTKLSEMVSIGATKGLYYKLGSDLTIDSVLGTKERPFEGIFEGDGKTLSLDYTADNIEGPVAPFAYINNAVIRNLNVTGDIYCKGGRAAGIVGENRNWSLILNCSVSANIEGGDNLGGFAVNANDALTIENCLFIGKITGQNNCAGFAAGGSSSLVLRDCVFDPMSGSSGESGATFVNDSYDTLENCVYYSEFGKVQGTPSIECYNNSVKSAKKLSVNGFKIKLDKKGRIAVIWKAIREADGYHLQYSKNKKFKKSVKSKKVSKAKAKAFLKNIKSWKKQNAGLKLYVRIRTYKRIKNPTTGKTEKVYGKWSKVRKIVIK